MKRILALMLGLTLALTLTLSLTACGGGGSDKSYCDDDFLKDMAKGLEARWEFSNSDEKNDLEENEIMSTAVTKELDVIGSYTDGTFENSTLQEYAISYINALKKQQEAIDYYNADYSKYFDMFDEAYLERCQLIVKINKEFGIPISSKYQKDLDDITKAGKKATEKDSIEKAIEDQLKDAEATREEDNLVLVLENTTDKTLKDVDFQIKYYDSDGVKIETDDCFVEDWEPGEKAKVSFWAYDIGYDSYEIVLDYVEY